MKRIITTIFILFIFTATTPMSVQANVQLDNLERSLYGIDFSSESDSVRIERLEKDIYGEKKSGDISKRIKNIQNDTGYIENNTPKPVNKNNSNVSNNLNSQLGNIYPVQQEDASVEYPIVDEMEKEVFRTVYKNEDIYKRLDRLEKQVFNRTTSDSLQDRVDRLRMSVKPAKHQNIADSYTADELDNYYSNSGLEQINDQSVPFQLAALEQDLLRNSFDRDNISSRLSRLEQKLFKRTFTSDSDVSRLQRIMVAYDAKKNSYKYDNNKRMQNMATASQIGGILLMILAILL